MNTFTEWLAENLDYLVFASVCVAGGALFHLRAIRAGRIHRRSRPVLALWYGALAVLLAGWFTVTDAGRQEVRQIHDLSRGLLATCAAEFEFMGYANLVPAPRPNDPLYARLEAARRRWLSANPQFSNLLLLRRRADGRLGSVVPAASNAGRENSPAAEAAFRGRTTFDDRIVPVPEGPRVTAFQPLRDASGRVQAVLAVDFHAEPWLTAIHQARWRFIGYLALFLVSATALGALVLTLRQEVRDRERSNEALRRAKEATELANRQFANVNRQLETAVTEARQMAAAAETGSQVKSMFLATISHELRTPLNGVIGMTTLLLDTNLDAEQRDYAETIRKSSESLLLLVNDTLDFARMESGKTPFAHVDFDLGDVVHDTVDLLAEKAAAQGLELICLIREDVPVWLRGDPGRIKQILMHLVSNALKFTDHGEVVIQIARETETETHATLRVDVRDSGIGIAAEVQPRLFLPFTQADSSHTRKYGGAGLGLAICRQLVEHMQGRIGLHSAPGQGSTFWFVVTLEKQPVSPARLPALVHHDRSARLLLVAVNEHARRSWEHHLRHWGAEVTATDDLRSGTVLLRGHATGFDLVLIDGAESLTELEPLGRALPVKPGVATTPLLWLTPWGQKVTPEETARLNVAAVLAKPCRAKILHECLTRLLAGSPPA